MNYEQKYNNAIESIKRIYDQADSYGRELMEKEFPELRDSEDERIRKELIERFKWELKGAEEQDAAGCSRQKDIAMFKRGIAWLEKQGEKQDTVTPQWMIDFLKDHRRHFGTPMDYDEQKETDGKMLAVIKWLEGNPQLEQKPAWSEEDENMRQDIISGLKAQIQSIYAHDEHGKAQMNNRIDWLKSLKPNHWKPSEEQMKYLKSVSTGWHPSLDDCRILSSLYNDLLKL